MTVAIVPAAGQGVRAAEGEGGKLFRPLLGRPLLVWTLEGLQGCALVDQVLVVTRPDRMADVERLVTTECLWKVGKLLPGGAERGDSVRAGLAALPPETTHVVVHDGARPLCPPSVLEQVILTAQREGAAIAAIPATDTVKWATVEGRIEATLDRGRVWLAQTPQAFERSLLERAHREAADDRSATDEAGLVERLGHPVRLVRASPSNLKVTRPEDYALAEALLQARAREAGR